jgi:hypothetical protein
MYMLQFIAGLISTLFGIVLYGMLNFTGGGDGAYYYLAIASFLIGAFFILRVLTRNVRAVGLIDLFLISLGIVAVVFRGWARLLVTEPSLNEVTVAQYETSQSLVGIALILVAAAHIFFMSRRSDGVSGSDTSQ